MTNYSIATPAEFIALRNLVNPKYDGYLSLFTEQDIATKQAYVHVEGHAAFLLDDGDIQSVFSLKPGSGKSAIQAAVQAGARTLDCMDGFLTTFYKGLWFDEYARFKFNESLAHPRWRETMPHKPDFVMLRIKPENIHRLLAGERRV